MRARVLFTCLLSSAIAGCGGDTGGVADAGPADGALDASCTAGAGRVVYLNRAGGTYSPGSDDSSANTSSIVIGTENIPAATFSDGDWATLTTCIAARYSPFAIELTDIDPGTAEHRELVFAPDPAALGLPGGTSGVAPFACPEGEVLEPSATAIAFVFPETLDDDLTAICQVSAQVLGSTFNLDHAFHCPDLMTFLDGCGDKTFVDQAVPCGEFSARECACGGETQNSYQTLLDLAGPSCE